MLKAPKSATVTVDGIDLGVMFGAFLAEGTSMPAPKPKTYTVDVPGGNGCIDLTEALTGDVAYKNRDAELVLAVPHPENWERSKSKIYSFLHGRRLPFTLGVDPGYTYTGRFSVKEDEYHGLPPDGVGIIKVKVSTNPYKLRERCSYRLNATGGRMYRLESGRRPVHPTIECDSACWVTWRGKTVTVPPGAFVLRDVVFREGWNEIYVNSQPLWLELWGDLSEGGKDAMTWGRPAPSGGTACTGSASPRTRPSAGRTSPARGGPTWARAAPSRVAGPSSTTGTERSPTRPST